MKPKHEHSDSPNSALYWLPRLTESELDSLVPTTAIVHYEHSKMLMQMEGEALYDGLPALVSQVRGCADLIGYPVFVRSDLASAKHSGPSAYKAESAEDVQKLLFDITEDGELKFWLTDYPQAFLIRRFLDLEHYFTAFADLPIAREWRFFASRSEIICAHPYWPAEAIEDHITQPENWRDLLAMLHEQPPSAEWLWLTIAAKRAAELCDRAERWSVDFAKDVNGKWWLIDMAVMEQSWHWPDCVNAKG